MQKRSPSQEIAAARKKVLDHKSSCINEISEKYAERTAELFFLQSGGNMMDYFSWRKKPPSAEFLHYLRTNPIDPEDDEDHIQVCSKACCVPAENTEVKPSVMNLPPALKVPYLSSIFHDTARVQKDINAKKEAYVMMRIVELHKEGLWSGKLLPKFREPPRMKTHWDDLLEEVVWLAADFDQERKWKKATAKKCARGIQKNVQEKAIQAQKTEKKQELRLRKITNFIAKEVRMFWSNVGKMIDYKQQTRLEEQRNKVLHQRLNNFVDQTVKYSKWLSESMNKTGIDATSPSVPPSVNSSELFSAAAQDCVSEFQPNESSTDNEGAIATKEKRNTQGNSEEVEMLKRESELPLEDLMKDEKEDYLENRYKTVDKSKSDNIFVNKDEFVVESHRESSDDEETIQEQEKAEGSVDHKEELAALKAEAEMSLQDLLAKYGGPNCLVVEARKDQRDKSDTESEGEAENGEGSDVDDDEKSREKLRLKSQLDDTKTSVTEQNEKTATADQEITDVAALAKSIQPKSNSLPSTNAVTTIPFLLKHTLREYQHFGLDWLVSMCDQNLNGILADEMGLGKTIQTISLLVHLACEKQCWGPHLIIVPTSVMLNWEMEFKKWCPAFKILTYYGTLKERKQKRTGWTKPNAFHVCITSYKLVIQDHQSFRRKKWEYLVLDEAQNIKNFNSKRWQLLVNFQTQRRLLLTGTPLQNDLMELWSLMHFLMPNVFQSHREFKEWFSNPVIGMIEGNSNCNDRIINRLHKVLRPFLLRRLKTEVEKQLPKKYEHIVMCRLSNRQQLLYDDYMSRAKTKETLATGNLLSVINVLMQLRKVCNHPNLFEVRPTVSPFQMAGIFYFTASLVVSDFCYDPFKHVNLSFMNFLLVELETSLTAFVAYRIKKFCVPTSVIEEIYDSPDCAPRCPVGKIKLRVRYTRNQQSKSASSLFLNKGLSLSLAGPKTQQLQNVLKQDGVQQITLPHGHAQLVQTSKRHHMFSESRQMVQAGNFSVSKTSGNQVTIRKCGGTVTSPSVSSGSRRDMNSVNVIVKTEADLTNLTVRTESGLVSLQKKLIQDTGIISDFYLTELEEQKCNKRKEKLLMIAMRNHRRCESYPIYGSDLRESLHVMDSVDPVRCRWKSAGYVHCLDAAKEIHTSDEFFSHTNYLIAAVHSAEEYVAEFQDIFSKFVFCVPAVSAPLPQMHVSHPPPSKLWALKQSQAILQQELSSKCALLHPIASAMAMQCPDPKLISYDSGKLQVLDKLLRRLKVDHHRVLIFTQMTRMLDVLEAFLNFHGHTYLRLDGTTRVDQRQILMEQFNADERIFCFILSTRSGGIGVNLTGADTVIFYDSDWNPTMDAQAQDRCHRIGQTRDVTIYRLVSEMTVEENILKKANQKMLLGDLAIERGNFTTAYFKSQTIHDLFNIDIGVSDASRKMAENNSQPRPSPCEDKLALGALESALAAAEDETDVLAARTAMAEAAAADFAEFGENKDEGANGDDQEISRAEQTINRIVQELTPVERYAMKFVEETDCAWSAEQLAAAEAEIEQQKGEWELGHQNSKISKSKVNVKKEEEEGRLSCLEDQFLTFAREDSQNHVGKSKVQVRKWWPPSQQIRW